MNLFGAQKPKEFLVVDINSSSVAAAYGLLPPQGNPSLTNAVELPFGSDSIHTGEILKTLETALGQLSTMHGKPPLHPRTALVYIGSPWLSSSVHVSSADEKKPFAFTHDMLAQALDHCKVDGGDCKSSVIAYFLNGYDTPKPFGKHVTRADIFILNTKLDPELGRSVFRSIRALFHTDDIHITSFGETVPNALLRAFPLQKDFLALRVTRDASTLALVKQGRLTELKATTVGSKSIEGGVERAGKISVNALQGKHGIDPKFRSALQKVKEGADNAWVEALCKELVDLASLGALPRVLYLLCEPEQVEYFSNLLNHPNIHEVWLSDEPLSIVPLSAKDFSLLVGGSIENTFLTLLSSIALA